jgi:hypothetical protein
VPAHRPITLRDLLIFRQGFGAIMEFPDRYPIQKAMTEAGLAPGPDPLPFSTDEFLARLGRSGGRNAAQRCDDQPAASPSCSMHQSHTGAHRLRTPPRPLAT